MNINRSYISTLPEIDHCFVGYADWADSYLEKWVISDHYIDVYSGKDNINNHKKCDCFKKEIVEGWIKNRKIYIILEDEVPFWLL